jgi:multidrug efflux pump
MPISSSISRSEVVFDRDKVRSQATNLSEQAWTVDIAWRRLREPLQHPGPKLQSDPEIKRAGRLSPEQLTDIYVTGSGDQLVPLSTFATLQTTTQPRELKKFQQLNAVRIQV